MATRRLYNQADLASNVAATMGNALTANLANSFAPESQNKVNTLSLRPTGGAFTSGSTATELFIDGIANYRLGTFDRMTMAVKALVTYNASVAGSNASFDVTATVQNVAGALTLIGTPVVTKAGTSAAGFSVGVDNNAAVQALTFTGAGVAGDTNGSWDMQIYSIVVSTDLG